MIREIVIPDLDQTTEQVVLARWLVNEGDAVRQGEAICEIETDKATAELESTASGILRKIVIEAGASIPPLTVVALIGEASDELPEIDPYYRTSRAKVPVSRSSQAEQKPVERRVQAGRIIASPRARRLAEERGIDLAAVEATGPTDASLRKTCSAQFIRRHPHR